MSYDSLSDSEQKSMRHLARAVIDQLAAGRESEDVVRELQANDWPLDEAREFVNKLAEERESYAGQWEIRFPDMKPIRHQPGLFMINGIGTALYGSRGRDPDTNTFVKTWCACIVFVPVLALGAFRVASAHENGWYMIGKVPLSRLAKAWNFTVLIGILLLVALGFWQSHTESPEYIAQQKMKTADKAMGSGELVKASQLYSSVAQGWTSHAQEARERLSEVCEAPALNELPPADITQVFELLGNVGGSLDRPESIYQAGARFVRKFASDDPVEAVRLVHAIWRLAEPEAQQLLTELLSGPWKDLPADTIREVYSEALTISELPEFQEAVVAQGMNWFQVHLTDDPRGALALADLLSGSLSTPLDPLEAARRQALENTVAANPNDVDLAVRLALELEPGGEDSAIKAVLLPVRAQLGDSEGARLFGQILAAEGDFAGAFELLSSYFEPRLASLHDAESDFQNAVTACQQRTLQQLQQGMVYDFGYTQYEAASEDEQQTMVIEYVSKKLQEDGRVNAARDHLLQYSAVVPAAMDLGIVTMRRAQAMADPQARREELEKAEKTFLAVQGIAGDDARFKLHVGQVYYWLGKHEEGKQEFDQLLENSVRSFETLLGVAQVLREIGAYGEARECIEEAYNKAADDDERHGAAHLRAITNTGLEDEISWLERCDQGEPSVRAGLQNTRGKEAQSSGNDEQAAKHYREAIASYDGMNETSASLNNSGLICLAMYQVTDDPTMLNDAITRFEKAVALEPDNAILLANAASGLFQAAVRDLAGDPEFSSVVSSGEISAFNYLVGDAAQYEQLCNRCRNHQGLRSAISYLDKTVILAPQNPGAYYLAVQIHSFLRDQEVMGQLANRIKDTTFDSSDRVEELALYYNFEEDDAARAQGERELAEAVEMVERCRRTKHQHALAYSASELLRHTIASPDMSSVDVNQLVQTVEESHAAAPTLGTHWSLASALMFRAHQALSKSFPEYAEAGETARRSLSPFITVVLVLSHDSPLGETARKNPDVQRAAELVKTRLKLFPSSRGTWSWALLQSIDPPAAEELTEYIKNDRVDQFTRDCMRKLAPYSAAHACYEHWARLAKGDTEDAREPIQEVIDRGLPMPKFLFGWNED